MFQSSCGEALPERENSRVKCIITHQNMVYPLLGEPTLPPSGVPRPATAQSSPQSPPLQTCCPSTSPTVSACGVFIPGCCSSVNYFAHLSSRLRPFTLYAALLFPSFKCIAQEYGYKAFENDMQSDAAAAIRFLINFLLGLSS